MSPDPHHLRELRELRDLHDVDDAFVPLAVVDRNGVDESWHRGAVVIVDPDGRVLAAAGDPRVRIFGRSALKPLQAQAMVDSGLRPSAEQLAVIVASHDGSPHHVRIVRSILEDHGLDEEELGNIADLPLDPDQAAAVLRAGGDRRPVLMNCSGKHAGMLASCVVNGWLREGYLRHDHPLQRRLLAEIELLTGDRSGSQDGEIGVDGCGAPAAVVTLIGLARAISSVARNPGPVAAAMREHPDLVAGPTRAATVLMRAVPGMIAKDGAEGVFVAATADGHALAVKIADGATRAVAPVVVDALGLLGIEVDSDDAALAPRILGGGRQVGTVRSSLTRVIGDTGT